MKLLQGYVIGLTLLSCSIVAILSSATIYAISYYYDLGISYNPPIVYTSSGVVSYTMSISNSGSTTMSGISVIEGYASGLVFQSFASMTGFVSTGGFVSYTGSRYLEWNNLTLSGNATGSIILNFLTQTGTVPGTTFFHTGYAYSSLTVASGACQFCTTPIVFSNSGFSVGYVLPKPIVIPPAYDANITLSGPISTLGSGDTFDLAIDIGLNQSDRDNLMIQINYATPLLKFNSFISSTISGVSALTQRVEPSVISGQVYNYDSLLTKGKVIIRNVSMLSGSTGQVILRFKMMNDYTTGMILTGTVGIPDEYNAITMLGDSNTGNNTTGYKVIAHPFDLSISKTLISGTEGPGNQVTYRITYYNSGVDRQNVIITDQFYTSSTGNILYDSISSSPSLGLPISMGDSRYQFNAISIASGSSGTIDITYTFPPCTLGSEQSAITIKDTYNQQLGLSSTVSDTDMEDQANEIDISNNTTGASAGGFACGAVTADQRMLGEISSASGALYPGQLVKIKLNYIVDTIGAYVPSIIENNSIIYALDPALRYYGIESGGDLVSILDEPYRKALTSPVFRYSFSTIDDSVNDNVLLKDCGYTPGVPTGDPYLDTGFVLVDMILGSVNQFLYGYDTYYSTYIVQGYSPLLSHLNAYTDSWSDAYDRAHTTYTNNLFVYSKEQLRRCYYHKYFTQYIYIGYSTGQAQSVAQQNALVDANVYSSLGYISSYMARRSLGDNAIRKTFVLDKNDYIASSTLYENSFAVGKQTNMDKQQFRNYIYSSAYDYYSTAQPYRYTSQKNSLTRNVRPTATIPVTGVAATTLTFDRQSYSALLSSRVNQLNWDGWVFTGGGWIQMFEQDSLPFADFDVFNDYTSQTGVVSFAGVNIVPNTTGSLNLVYRVTNTIASGATIQSNSTIGYTNSSTPGRLCYPGDIINQDYSYCLANDYDFSQTNDGDAPLGNDNTGSASYSLGSPLPFNLSVSKTLYEPASFDPKSDVVYEITLCNNDVARSDIGLLETYSPGLVFNSIIRQSFSGLFFHGSMHRELLWTNISLGSGSCASVVVSYLIDEEQSNVLLETISQVGLSLGGGFSGPFDLDNNDNIAIQTGLTNSSWTILPQPYGNKTIYASSYLTGEVITYSLTYANVSNQTGILTLSDNYGPELSFSGQSYSSDPSIASPAIDSFNRILTWSPITLSPQSSGEIRIDFVIDSGLSVYDILNNEFSYSISYPPLIDLYDDTNSSNDTINGIVIINSSIGCTGSCGVSYGGGFVPPPITGSLSLSGLLQSFSCPYSDGDFESYKRSFDVPGLYKTYINTMLQHCLVHGYDNDGVRIKVYNDLTYGELYKVMYRLTGQPFIPQKTGYWSNTYYRAGMRKGYRSNISIADPRTNAKKKDIIEVTKNILKKHFDHDIVFSSEETDTLGSRPYVKRGNFFRWIHQIITTHIQ